MCGGIAVIFPPLSCFFFFFCCVTCRSHPFHPIPADVWWMLRQNVHTEHYWLPTSPLKRLWSIDRPGGIDASSLSIQTSSNEQRHVITSFKEALRSVHRPGGVRSPSSSLLFLSQGSWSVLHWICSSADRFVSVRFRWLDCGILNSFQCESLRDDLLD